MLRKARRYQSSNIGRGVTKARRHRPDRRRLALVLGGEALEERCLLSSVSVVAPISAAPMAITATEGVAFSGPVVTFTDSSPSGSLAATVDWGNGHTSAGTISAPDSSGNFTVMQELQVMAPYTQGIRTYSRTGDLAPAAQMAHSLGLKTAIGAWISKDATDNQAEIDSLVSEAIKGYVDVAIVGSEALLRGDVNAGTLTGYIDQIRSRLQAAGVNIPVTAADTYNTLEQPANAKVLADVDIVYANFFPYWEGTSIDGAMASLNKEYRQLAALGKPVFVSESGFPSDGSPNGAAVPSPANAAYYFLDFASWAQANNVSYAYFEAFDEPWKYTGGDVGPHWGVFDSNGVLKPGMLAVFNGQTVPDNWSHTGPAPIDFFAMPSSMTTNLSTFVVAGETDPTNTVTLNGAPIPPGEHGCARRICGDGSAFGWR